MAVSSVLSERATYRTVVLLRRSEKLKLERLASREKVSSAEVIRRFIRSGEEMLKQQQDEEVIAVALKMIAAAVAEANESMTRTMDKVDALHLEMQEPQVQ